MGDDVSISCVSMLPVIWTKNDKEIQKKGNLVIINNNIYIKGINQDQRGIYFCDGSDENRATFSNNATVKVGGMHFFNYRKKLKW